MAVAALTNAPSLYPSDAYIGSKPAKQTRSLVSDLCRRFYTHGWVSGTGGSITIKVRDDSVPKHQQFIVMSSSGVQKERMVPEDMYVLTGSGSIVSAPSPNSYPHKPPKSTDCAPLFMKAECYHYLFEAALKMHQLGLDCSSPSHLPIQSIKGVLAGGRKSRGLLKAQVVSEDREGKQPSRLCILLDIEGTTTPISFVSDVLFPYARDNVENHLAATYDTRETQEDIKLLRAQVEEDLKQGVVGSRPIPPDEAGKDEVIASIVANVQTMIKADRKITALKQLQGHIWRTGFENNELQGVFFEDVPEALHKWHSMGIKVYIYSSGSREAQRQIFGNTAYGDLRKYLCGFFDTTIGNKRETHSYFEISQSLGVDKPSQILFLTDVYQEAVAANAAGLEVMISVRPGNGALPDNHKFKTIKSFLEI